MDFVDLDISTLFTRFATQVSKFDRMILMFLIQNIEYQLAYPISNIL